VEESRIEYSFRYMHNVVSFESMPRKLKLIDKHDRERVYAKVLRCLCDVVVNRSQTEATNVSAPNVLNQVSTIYPRASTIVGLIPFYEMHPEPF